MTARKKFLLEFSLALGIFLALMLIFRVSNIDLAVSDKAYEMTSFKISAFLTGLAWIGKYLAVLFCAFLVMALPWMWKKNHRLKKEAALFP